MKKLFCSILLPTFLSIGCFNLQASPPIDTTIKIAYLDSLKKANADTLKKYRELVKNDSSKNEERTPAQLTPILSQIVVIAFFIVMLTLFIFFFWHIRKHDMYIGYQSIKLIGLILIFPGICILAIVGGTHILAGQTLAVLLGTIAGYVLSRDDDNKGNRPGGDSAQETALRNQLAQLEQKLKTIRDKNPTLIE